MDSFDLKPIGFFKSNAKYPQQVARQAVEGENNSGYIELKNLYPLEQAAEDLKTCPKIWLIYLFHRNKTWNPKVYPPRSSDKKIGVLATRAPYRPNPIGLSCVDVEKIIKNKIYIKNHDLLDGSPILDIKPYLAKADAFPNVSPKWMLKEEEYQIRYSEKSLKKISWLNQKMKMNVELLLKDQLSFQPFYKKRKRIVQKSSEEYTYSYRTWRFDLDIRGQQIYVKDIYSGYSREEILNLLDDPYGDKNLHQDFKRIF